jgi:hypothetical protein
MKSLFSKLGVKTVLAASTAGILSTAAFAHHMTTREELAAPGDWETHSE